MWRGAGFTNTMWAWSVGFNAPSRQWFYVSDGPNDKANSLFNFRDDGAYVGENVNWHNSGGGHACIKGGEELSDLGVWAFPQNFKGMQNIISGVYLDNVNGNCNGEARPFQIG
jgi:hypothetical protein